MCTFDLIKKVFHIPGEVTWGIIEETVNGKTKLKPGCILKGESIFLDLYDRKFYSPVSLDVVTRKITPAVMTEDSEYVVLTISQTDEKLVLPNGFVDDILLTSFYHDDLKNQTLL